MEIFEKTKEIFDKKLMEEKLNEAVENLTKTNPELYVNDKLLNHPIFMKALTTACETLVSNTGENKYTISIESGKVIVSSDRNSKWFERTFCGSIVPGNEHEYFEYSEIGLDEELLIVKNGIGIRTPEPLNNLCTLYDYKAYFEDIQLSHHVFKNSENLTDRHSSEPLEQLVKVHKNPITGRWENSNIETENFVNAVYRDREFSTLGMFREITTFKMPDGRRIKECEIYPSGIQYPEIIYFDEPEKVATYDFKTQKYYDKEQNEIDEQELTNLLNQRYLQGLETSKTKEYSPQTYQRILEYIRGNILIHKEKMEIIKDKIAPELLANPVFIREFNRACEMIFKMTGENACDVQISEDGKMITIVQENTKNIQCQNKNNHYFIATNITLDDEQLNVEQCRGTLYKNENDTSGYVVDAYYTDEVYDEKGIQLKHSWYEDSQTFTGTIPPNLTNQILNYMRPNFKQKWLPSIPTFCNKPSIGCICREDGTLGVARKITKEGINGETNHNLYKISTNYPETLQIDANTPIAYSYLERVNSDVYGDITLDELKTQVDKEFIAGIENSYTKQYNPETYQRLLDIIEEKKHTK